MKKLIICSVLLLIPTFSFSEKIQLEWNYSTEDQAKIDGFKLFMKKPSTAEYDYSNPIATISPSDRSYQIDVNPGENENITYSFVVRAYKDDKESADSNQVGYLVVGIVPAIPVSLAGEYNSETSILNLSWEQPVDDFDVWKWIVYYRLEGDDKFIEIGRVDKGQSLTLTKAFDAVGPGQSKTVFFTVVAFRRDHTVHSQNAAEFAIVIDRRVPPVPPDNLIINIEIPVGNEHSVGGMDQD
ncbi:MAG: fibronectin type III domain-containing protein [Phycisphaerales bacterium]|jgi:hypothetical protein